MSHYKTVIVCYCLYTTCHHLHFVRIHDLSTLALCAYTRLVNTCTLCLYTTCQHLHFVTYTQLVNTCTLYLYTTCQHLHFVPIHDLSTLALCAYTPLVNIVPMHDLHFFIELPKKITFLSYTTNISTTGSAYNRGVCLKSDFNALFI